MNLSKRTHVPSSLYMAFSGISILTFVLLHIALLQQNNCVTATSFFSQTSNTKQQSSNAAGDQATSSKITSTQVNIATTGLPLSTPNGFWSPFQQFQNPNQRAKSKEGSGTSKHPTHSFSIGELNLVGMRMLQGQILSTIDSRSLQEISERLTTSVVQPMWNVAVKAIEDQLLSHVHNTISQSAIASKTADDVAADPGDFLGEVHGWSAYFDREGTCLVYYFHKQTGVSQWEIPYPNYPTPKLNLEQIKMMERKYEESHSSTNQQGKDLFRGIHDLFSGSGGNNKNTKEPEKKPDKPWWSSVLEVVFENQESLRNDESKEDKLLLKNEQLPFFASIADEGDNRADSHDSVPPSTKSNSVDIFQSMDSVSTTLSPWWDMLRAVVTKAAATMESPSQIVPVVNTPENQPTIQRQQNQAWDYFFPTNMKDDEDFQSTITLKPSKETRPEATADVDTKNVLGWMSDLPLFLTRDVSRTVPLFGLFSKKSNDVREKALIVSATVPLKDTAALHKQKQPSHAERLKVIEEKRYAASRARQANLRKVYGTVIHDRSPTVSLTSLKLQKSKLTNHNVDWYKYLND